jgi:hypothetical protein
MELYMGWKWYSAIAVLAALLLGSCGIGGGGETAVAAPDGEAADERPDVARNAGDSLVYDAVPDAAALGRALEEMAELERSGGFIRGMGLAESGLRESAGDYAGAVAAAYKELAWAYGGGAIQRDALEEGLGNVLALRGNGGDEDALRITAHTAEGILAFTRGRWDDAAVILRSQFDEKEEPDGFARWMILACALEKDRGDKQAGAAYRAIRARYALFPEYWFRGARAFGGAIGAEFAERCIGLAPEGPFAGECRNILAVFAGLKNEDGSALKSKTEIENIISWSLSQGNPEMLAPLMPLVSLPDNPYTVYAVGALRALAAVPQYRDYFNGLASGSVGRLAERLAYICRG